MGFPVVYSEMPRLLLNLLFLLGHLRRVSSWLLRLAGADDFAFDYAATSDAFADDTHYLHYHEPPAASCGGGGELELEEHSPAVRFDALSEGGAPLPEGCAVCLGDFHAAARVRRPRGCRHVFHRACLDRWAAHGHRTCPLCRALLLPSSPPAPAPASHGPVLLPMPLPAS